MSQSDHGRKPGVPHAAEIPDKLYFRIGEVARLLGVAPYVLRFWEGEFPHMKPNKGGTGQRLYRRRDVEAAFRIRQLLYDEGYTIAGARQAIKAENRNSSPRLPLQAESPVESISPAQLRPMQAELREIAAILARPSPLLGRGALLNPAHKGLHVAAGRKSPAGPAGQGATGPLFVPEGGMGYAPGTKAAEGTGMAAEVAAAEVTSAEVREPEDEAGRSSEADAYIKADANLEADAALVADAGSDAVAGSDADAGSDAGAGSDAVADLRIDAE